MGIDEIRKLKSEATQPKERRVYRISPKSEKKKMQEVIEREGGSDAALDRWFEDGRKAMTGICLFCGGKTEKHNDATYRNSEAHLFPKRKNMFPSIATHPENMVELCFFGNSCHTNFDNNIIAFEDIKYQHPEVWKEIIRKVVILYPVMTKQEKNKVPEILLNEIKNG